jgi:leucyl aminopeptidase
MIGIKVREDGLDKAQTALLVIGEFENGKDILGSKFIDHTIKAAIAEVIQNNEFKSTFGSCLMLHLIGRGPIRKIMLMGLGKREKFTNEKARVVAGKAALEARKLSIDELIVIPFSKVDDSLIEAISEGLYLSLYSFQKYKTNHRDASSEPGVATILVESDSERFQKIADKTSLTTQAVEYTRDISNLPPNECAPGQIAKFALALEEFGIKVTILERYEMESIGLNGIVSVGRGSNNPPKLIVMEYHRAPNSKKPYLLVGKAVTFDTGGISLKPGDKMEEMKFDKCGGCAVLGILKAIALLDLKINVIGIVPSVENMPSSSSYRPGEIITMYNGKTVEVLNTDAEGRIILADAIAYGISKFEPKEIIDLATLTGAAIIALGANVAALIGSNEKLKAKLLQASEKTGERIWELPLFEEYNEQIKSSVADLKNIGGRPGGAITAAAFLSNFTNDVPWVHLDIAGTAWTQDGTYDKSYNPKGATGFGVRTVIKYLMDQSNE